MPTRLADVKKHFTYASVRGGIYTIRRGFFYTMGKSSYDLKEAVVAAFPDATILEHGEVWKPFIGGASVRRQSHWFVKFTL